VDYQTKLLSLLARCEDLVEKRQINIFTAGLRNPPKTDVELKNLATLEDAMALARTYEQRLSLQEDVPAHASPPGRATPIRLASSLKPQLLPVPPSATGAKEFAASPTAPRLKQLTAVEMTTKRERDECYNCLEKFSREHIKVCPMKGIYLLQMTEDDASHEEEADPSFHSTPSPVSPRWKQCNSMFASGTVCSAPWSTLGPCTHSSPSPWPVGFTFSLCRDPTCR
jgi:hypothetical protein